MRASRLLSILITLQLHGRVSARELARRFEVTKRTIYRDVDALSAAGVPIYAERGAMGGFALLDGWRTHLTGLTDMEARAVFLAQLPQAADALGLGVPAAGARLKLLAALPGPSGETARRVSERFHVDPAGWGRRPPAEPTALRVLAQGAWEDRRVRMRYESWRGEAVRTVAPLGLVMKAGDWYFLAAGRGGPAIHRLDKVTDAALLDDRFERPPDFDLAAAWAEGVRTFEAGLRRNVARLRVEADALSRIERLGADMAEPILAARPDASGAREADVPIESIGHAAGLLLGLADVIEVLTPQELRAEIASRARAAVRRHSASGS